MFFQGGVEGTQPGVSFIEGGHVGLHVEVGGIGEFGEEGDLDALGEGYGGAGDLGFAFLHAGEGADAPKNAVDHLEAVLVFEVMDDAGLGDGTDAEGEEFGGLVDDDQAESEGPPFGDDMLNDFRGHATLGSSFEAGFHLGEHSAGFLDKHE